MSSPTIYFQFADESMSEALDYFGLVKDGITEGIERGGNMRVVSA